MQSKILIILFLAFYTTSVFGIKGAVEPPHKTGVKKRSFDTIGDYVSHQIYKGLEPLRRHRRIRRMKFGFGGTTVATFEDDVQFIIKDGVKYRCDGKISLTQGSCSGTLKEVENRNDKDFCYAIGKTEYDDKLCLGDGNVRFHFRDGIRECISSDNAETTTMTRYQFKKLCGSNRPTYRFYGRKRSKYARYPLSNCHDLEDDRYVCKFDDEDFNSSSYTSYSSSSNTHYIRK